MYPYRQVLYYLRQRGKENNDDVYIEINFFFKKKVKKDLYIKKKDVHLHSQKG